MSDMISALRRHGWAGEFSDEDLALLLKTSKTEVFQSGDILLEEGETSFELFVVVAGTVEVCKGIGGPGGSSYVLQELEAPAEVGEMAFIDPCKRIASVKAKTEVTALRFCQKAMIEHKIPDALRHQFLSCMAIIAVRYLRDADTALLQEVDTRGRFGRFVVLVLLLFVLQNYLTAFFHQIAAYIPLYMITAIALVIATTVCLIMIRTVQRPLGFFGLSTHGWKRSLLEGSLAGLAI